MVDSCQGYKKRKEGFYFNDKNFKAVGYCIQSSTVVYRCVGRGGKPYMWQNFPHQFN